MITTRNTTIMQIDISVPVVHRVVSLSSDQKEHERTYRAAPLGRCGYGSGGNGGRIDWLAWGLQGQGQVPLQDLARKVLFDSQV